MSCLLRPVPRLATTSNKWVVGVWSIVSLVTCVLFVQLFRRVAAALPGMESTPEKPKDDCILENQGGGRDGEAPCSLQGGGRDGEAPCSLQGGGRDGEAPCSLQFVSLDLAF